MAWQKVKIAIDKDLTPTERKEIANEVIEFIKERTQRDGRDKDGKLFRPLKGYSKAYKNSDIFKAAGKTNFIDLTLTGEMLEALKLTSHRNGSITIGYDKGDKELNGKVEGNRKGTYGQSKQVAPKRDFLGIKQEELDKIVNKYKRNKDA